MARHILSKEKLIQNIANTVNEDKIVNERMRDRLHAECVQNSFGMS